MAIFKVLLEIKGTMIDIWSLKRISRDEEYNEIFGRMDYNLWINRDAMILEFKDVKFTYATEEEREKDYKRIKEALDNHDTVLILSENAEEKQFNENNSLDDVDSETIQNDKDEEEAGN